jgi:hypothetical protein
MGMFQQQGNKRIQEWVKYNRIGWPRKGKGKGKGKERKRKRKSKARMTENEKEALKKEICLKRLQFSEE